MKSVYLKNFTTIVILVALCVILVMLSGVTIVRSYVLSERHDEMWDTANGIAKLCSVTADNGDLTSWNLGMSINVVSNATGNRIIVADGQGRIFHCSDSHPICRHLEKNLPESFLTDIDNNGESEMMTDLEGLLEAEESAVGVSVDSNGETIGYVVVLRASDAMLGAWSDFLGLGILIAFGILFLAIGAGMYYSKRMAQPLDEIAAASRKFARGDFSVRVKQIEQPTQQMGALIESFNIMADSLECAEKRRSEFIANVSHELRTPMTTISGFAEGILDGTIPHEQEERYLISIRDETTRLSRLVREMLDVSQTNARVADETKRTVFDISELVLQILLSFESRAVKKNLDVDPQLPDNSLMVKADKDAITRVIYNLIDNAVKFAYSDSCITIKLYKFEGKAYFSISDEGDTIPPDDLPFIFDRFHKSDKSRSMDKDGVGLGLYFVKAIINSHDEDIAVKSDNHITEFVFSLPLAE